MRHSLKNERIHSRLVRGYTLLELAISILIMGIIMSAVGGVAVQYLKAKHRNTTLNNASILVEALNAYMTQYGHYPCPSPVVPRLNKYYGIAGDCSDTTVAIGTCGYQGNAKYDYCVQESNRKWDSNPPKGFSPSNWKPKASTNPPWSNRVRRGEVPFRTLGIPEYEAIDGYGDEYEYVVSEGQATPGHYNKYFGAIDVLNGNASDPLSPFGHPSATNTPKYSISGGGVDYVLISNGPDRAGAYTSESVLSTPVHPCGYYGATALDTLNCELAFNNKYAVYITANYATAHSAHHFDDTIMFFTADKAPLWKVSGKYGTDIINVPKADGSSPIVTVQADHIPSNAPQSSALQIGGTNDGQHTSVLVSSTQPSEGKLILKQSICNGMYGGAQTSQSCAPADMTLKCPKSNEYATGFHDGTLLCQHLNKLPSVTCGKGQSMTGIDANGNIICGTVQKCQPTTKNLCGTQTKLPPSGAGYAVGSIYTLGPYGTGNPGYSETYECKIPWQGASPQWVMTSSGGNCTPCSNQSKSTTMDCNAAKNNWPCNNCWTGSVTKTVTTYCTPSVHYQTTYTGAASCTCNATSYPHTNNCPTGYTGTYTATQHFICNSSNPTQAATWYWTSTQSTDCKCVGATQTRKVSCSQAYGLDPQAYPWPAEQVPESSTLDCSTGKWSAWTPTQPESTTCTCHPYTVTLNPSCPSGQTGSITETETYDCTTNSMGNPVPLSNTCATAVPTWQTSGAPYQTNVGTTGTLPKAGNTCSPSGQSGNCYQASSTSGYDYYNCVCQ